MYQQRIDCYHIKKSNFDLNLSMIVFNVFAFVQYVNMFCGSIPITINYTACHFAAHHRCYK